MVDDAQILYGENIAVAAIGNVSEGGLSDTLSCGGWHNASSLYGLIFEVDGDVLLNYADVMASQTGEITVTYTLEDPIYGWFSPLYNSKSFSVQQGWNHLDLNIPVVGSNRFKLSFSSDDGTELYREQDCANFPMPLGEIGQIVGTNVPEGTPQGYYYYFYNIGMSELELTSCSSGRFPLPVDRNPFLCGDLSACNYSPESTDWWLAENCCYNYECQIVACSENSITVASIIHDSPSHNILENALFETGLSDALTGSGPFTVFAPTDDAVYALIDALEITIDEFLALPNLADILQYHLVGDEAYSTDLTDGQEIETLLGEDITVSFTADGVFINDAQVTVVDLAADNGVVHVIDAVLLPELEEETTVVDIIAAAPNLSMMDSILIQTDLVNTLAGSGPYTVFAPSDDAFDAIPNEALEALFQDDALMQLLLSDHISEGQIYTADVFDNMLISTLSGGDVLVTITDGALFIDYAQVTFADLEADNGVVHVIDGVLIPEFEPAEDELPWSNQCAVDSCYAWVFGNGSGASGAPWEGVDLNFECSLDGPSGPYNQWAGGVGDFTPAPVMNSSTSSNGVLIVDSDLYGAEENYSASWVENSWVQTAEPINCSATEFIRMSFQTRYRCWDNGASDDSEKCLVEVSRDGVNWPDIATFSEEEGFVEYGTGELVPSRWEVFPDYQTGSQTENPSIINLDISPAAGGQDEVWIRFRWSGTWGFSWEIDDIILAAFPENDLEIGYVSTTDYLNTGDLELGALPLGQLTTHQAGVAVVNTGLADQNQISVGLSSAGQSLGASEMTTIANGTETLFQFDYSLVGLDTGMHLLEFEIQNDGSPLWDESPDDNIQAKSIEVTEYQMGRDDGVMTGSFPTDEADNFSVINPFQIYENDTVYAIDVAFAEGSALTSDLLGYLQVGQSMEDVNYTYANFVTGAWENAVGEQMLNAPGDSIIKWTTLLLEEPLAVAAGDWVGAVIESYAFPEPVRIGMAQDVYPNTCFVEGPFGSGGSWGSYYIPTAPMIRLNFDPNAQASGWGCLDEASCNYNPNAFEPYLYCDTTSCAGCLDPIACNYDPSFTLSNSEYCTYPGCQDSSANNYDPGAGCEGECNYLAFDCSSLGEEGWSNEAMGLFPEWQTAMHGMEWFGEWVLNIPATIIEPSSGVSYAIHHMNWMGVEGLPDWVENVTYELGELDASSQHCISAFGTPSEPGIHEVTATGEVFISIFGQPFSIGEQSFSAWLEVEENPNPIPGCTYATAQNFLVFATLDDGSCEFAGCTDPEADNFNPLATIDDASCGEGCDPASDSSCQADNDGDGLISVSDLLILLGEFGSVCE